MVTCHHTLKLFHLSHVTAELAAAGAEAAGLPLQQYQDACICQVIHLIDAYHRHAAAAVALRQRTPGWVLLDDLLVWHHCHRSAGKKVDFDGEEHTIQELTEDRWEEPKHQHSPSTTCPTCNHVCFRLPMVLIKSRCCIAASGMCSWRSSALAAP